MEVHPRRPRPDADARLLLLPIVLKTGGAVMLTAAATIRPTTTASRCVLGGKALIFGKQIRELGDQRRRPVTWSRISSRHANATIDIIRGEYIARAGQGLRRR